MTADKALIFDQHFSEIYGERWPQLRQALLANEVKVARINAFYKEDPSLQSLGPEWGLGKELSDPPGCREIFENFDLNRFTTPILPVYRMDPASLFPALALDAKPGERVLDMCAAPGGKSLVVIEAMQGEGEFTANELAAKRRFRMMSVFKRYLPKDIRAMVKITGKDGSRIGLGKKDYFDRILLDAPCSGERGVVQKASELAQWKPKRTKSFAIRQYALLSSAFMALKPGGRLVYSTCSISPAENDGVIDKLFKRHEGLFDVLESPFAFGEKTQHGIQFLPDQEGWGPIFYSILEKRA
ncbi:MAG: RsmB/NOP family class I SAM-dependent RNA methyltransferase [Bdellovibrionales bacterium]|nr:RsmB/NOP family class I SAM-dependent RNA methyltransferase [Bdellovibrionales bacterium]